MKTRDILKAKMAAQLFIQRADAVVAEREESGSFGRSGTAASGALRRMSMELTRKLSTMRKP